MFNYITKYKYTTLSLILLVVILLILYYFINISHPLSLWKYWYEYITKFDIETMNYGYYDESKNEEIKHYDQCSLNLYNFVCKDLSGEVLEIGCGRGAGLYHIAKQNPHINFTGLDYSESAIKKAKQLYKLNNLKFVQGNAMKLPFKNNTFDVVINLESSHCYDDISAFIKEVHRVLKKNGIFNFADIRTYYTLDNLNINKQYFNIIKKEDISKNVVKSMEKTEPFKKEKISNILKKCNIVENFLINTFGKQFAGTTDSIIYKNLQNGSTKYLYIQYKKNS